MSNKKQIVVTDWIKRHCHEANFLNLTLSSDQRRVFRGKRKSDCNQELQLQLPRAVSYTHLTLPTTPYV